MSEESSKPLILKLPDAATHLGVSPHTLRKWTRAGKVPVMRLDGKLRYSAEALRKWVEEQSVITVG